MDTYKILADLRSERDRIDQAIAALEALDSTTPRTTGRAPAKRTSSGQATSGRRTISAAARRAMSRAAKRNWALRKGQSAQSQPKSKEAAPKTVAAKRAKSGITAAGRKRISEMMKKRWAERRKAAKAA